MSWLQSITRCIYWWFANSVGSRSYFWNILTACWTEKFETVACSINPRSIHSSKAAIVSLSRLLGFVLVMPLPAGASDRLYRRVSSLRTTNEDDAIARDYIDHRDGKYANVNTHVNTCESSTVNPNEIRSNTPSEPSAEINKVMGPTQYTLTQLEYYNTTIGSSSV